MPVNGDTLITVEGKIKPIKIGASLNGGKSTLLSVAMSDGVEKKNNLEKLSLLVSGNFVDDELVY